MISFQTGLETVITTVDPQMKQYIRMYSFIHFVFAIILSFS